MTWSKYIWMIILMATLRWKRFFQTGLQEKLSFMETKKKKKKRKKREPLVCISICECEYLKKKTSSIYWFVILLNNILYTLSNFWCLCPPHCMHTIHVIHTYYLCVCDCACDAKTFMVVYFEFLFSLMKHVSIRVSVIVLDYFWFLIMMLLNPSVLPCFGTLIWQLGLMYPVIHAFIFIDLKVSMLLVEVMMDDGSSGKSKPVDW